MTLLAFGFFPTLGCVSTAKEHKTYSVATVTPERAARQAIDDADRGQRYFVGILGFALQLPGVTTSYRDRHPAISIVTMEGMDDTSSETDAQHREAVLSAVVANAIMKEFIDRDEK